ncbi:MAG: regulatory protein RecX [Firmicutes bacterium]|nr:regulatory protein RecX [Bacillota bacterium]
MTGSVNSGQDNGAGGARDFLTLALRWLARSDLTVHEMSERLSAEGCPEPETRRILDWLQGRRYLDDRRLADRAVEKAMGACQGRQWLRTRLESRGVPGADIEAALSSYSSEREWQLAEKAAERYLAGIRGLPAMRRRQRLGDWLLRRGFDPEMVASVVEKHVPLPED